jgi:uncharacterized protein (DUF1015 family)
VADFRPFRGLRYNPSVAGSLGDLIAPPFDVISAEAQDLLHERSPFNVIRLEYGRDGGPTGDDRYRRAARILREWRDAGVLALDERPSFYLYEQEFEHDGARHHRRSIIGRVRLEPWDAGVILPHEHTMSGPKQDRLRLLRACRTDISPIFSLYRSDGGQALAWCSAASGDVAPAEAVDSAGQTHRLWVVDEPLTVQRLERHFEERVLYIADGHHRYETALTYRDERQEAEVQWSGDEPENFVLMALTAADDPGLLILPIHRLVQPLDRPADLRMALNDFFALSVPEGEQGQQPLAALLSELATARGDAATFGGIGIEPERPLMLTLRDRTAIERLMPRGHSDAWRMLDVNVLQYGLLQPLLGIDVETVRAGGHVAFTESAEEAWQAVETGRMPLAFLLNPTRADEIFAVADAGDRMPQKSTFFFPKLGTGLVLYGFDANPVASAAGSGSAGPF